VARVLSRRTIGWGLCVYWAVVWWAVVFQIDEFPLTYVPMYGGFKPDRPIEIRLSDSDATKRGLRVTHRDGTVDYVTRADLNLTKRHFRRLYRQRMFSSEREHWPYRVLRSLNRTLGYGLDDPGFIVRVESEIGYWIVRRSDLHTERETRRADHEWLPAYDAMWRDEAG
jgi:hypothetical protein